MSEYFAASVSGYSEVAREALAREAGLPSTLASAATGSVRGAIAAFREEVRCRSRGVTRSLDGGPESRLLADVLSTDLGRELGAVRAELSVLSRAECALLAAAARREGLGDVASLEEELNDLEIRSRRSGAAEGLIDEAGQLRRSIEVAVGTGARLLLAAESAVLGRAVTASLADSGYASATRRPGPNGAQVIGGTDGRGRSVWVLLDPRQGQLQADFVGFEGTACLAERRHFVERLAEHGVRIRFLGRDLHGDPEGGSLAREVDADAKWAQDRAVGNRTLVGGTGDQRGAP